MREFGRDIRFALRMQGHMGGRRRNHDGEGHSRTADFGRGVNLACLPEGAWDQLDPVERCSIATQREFASGAVGRVVVDLARQFRERRRFEVEGVDELVQDAKCAGDGTTAGCARWKAANPAAWLDGECWITVPPWDGDARGYTRNQIMSVWGHEIAHCAKGAWHE